MDEQETALDVLEGMEAQPDTGETLLDIDAGLGMPLSDMESSAGNPETSSESVLELPADSPSSDSEIPAALDADLVAQIVDALLESDRVTDLMQSMETTLLTVADAIPVIADDEEEEQPMIVVDADELLDRLEARQAETAAASEDAVRASSVQSAQAVAAAPALTSGGEVLIPGERELTVIEVVQSILEYFQKDDNDLLTAIRDNTDAVKQTVGEIKTCLDHPLMETPFEQYSVLEGLLLVLVLWLVVLNPCLRMIRGGFSWLL